MLDSPNSEFVNNYNLVCMVDILADEIVSTEIDQEENDRRSTLQCGDQSRCAYYIGRSSIYETRNST